MKTIGKWLRQRELPVQKLERSDGLTINSKKAALFTEADRGGQAWAASILNKTSVTIRLLFIILHHLKICLIWKVSFKLTFQAGNSTKCFKYSNNSLPPHFLFTCNNMGATANAYPAELIPKKRSDSKDFSFVGQVISDAIA